MKIYLAADHAGFALKNTIKKHLEDAGFSCTDEGAHMHNPDDDYPDFMHHAAKAVARAPEENRAILFGGSGQGEAMVANRHADVRAAVFYGQSTPREAVDIEGTETEDPFAIVRLAREHNNANVLSLAARFVDEETAKKAVDTFLETPFSGAQRHERRIKKIDHAG